MNETSESKKSDSWWSKINKITVVASLIGAVIGALGYTLFFEDRIVNRIVDKLKSPEIIQQIASLVRPSVIFDQKGTIVHDSGGAQFIKEIKVEMTTPENPKSTPEPNKIFLFPTKHLKEPLILECLNRDMDFMCKRINTIDWECEVDSPDRLLLEHSKFHGEWKFRLEVIP